MKHTVRHKDYGIHGDNKLVEVNNYTRGLAIKMFCTECLGHEDHPDTCTAPLCPLFPFRGKSQKAWK